MATTVPNCPESGVTFEISPGARYSKPPLSSTSESVSLMIWMLLVAARLFCARTTIWVSVWL